MKDDLYFTGLVLLTLSIGLKVGSILNLLATNILLDQLTLAWLIIIDRLEMKQKCDKATSLPTQNICLPFKL